MSNKVYDFLKEVALFWLPLLAFAYQGMAGIWGLPAPEQVVGTLVLADTILGGVLHISTNKYNKALAAKNPIVKQILEETDNNTTTQDNTYYD